MGRSLEELRIELDDIDKQLVGLLALRFGLTGQVGVYKRDNGLAPVDVSREEQQFAGITELAKTAGLDPDFAQRFLRLIIDEVVAHHTAIQAAGSQ
jgi:chorismate mutase